MIEATRTWSRLIKERKKRRRREKQASLIIEERLCGQTKVYFLKFFLKCDVCAHEIKMILLFRNKNPF